MDCIQSTYDIASRSLPFHVATSDFSSARSEILNTFSRSKRTRTNTIAHPFVLAAMEQSKEDGVGMHGIVYPEDARCVRPLEHRRKRATDSVISVQPGSLNR